MTKEKPLYSIKYQGFLISRGTQGMHNVTLKNVAHRDKSVCRTAKAQDATDVKVNALIEKIGHDRVDIPSDYKNWFAIGCAFAAEYGKIAYVYSVYF